MKFTDRVKEFVYRQQFPSNEFGKEGWRYSVGQDGILVTPCNADGSSRGSFEMSPATAQKIEVLHGNILYFGLEEPLPFKNLREISGDLSVRGSNVSSLPEQLEKIGGTLFIEHCPIESLPKTLKNVGGNVVFEYVSTTTLPDNLKIGNDLLVNSSVTSIPSSVEVEGKIYDDYCRCYRNPDYAYTSEDIVSFLNARDEIPWTQEEHDPNIYHYLEMTGRFDNTHESNAPDKADVSLDKNVEKYNEESIDDFIERLGKLNSPHETRTFSNEVELDDLER